jgi:hypothetical protein
MMFFTPSSSPLTSLFSSSPPFLNPTRHGRLLLPRRYIARYYNTLALLVAQSLRLSLRLSLCLFCFLMFFLGSSAFLADGDPSCSGRT